MASTRAHMPSDRERERQETATNFLAKCVARFASHIKIDKYTYVETFRFIHTNTKCLTIAALFEWNPHDTHANGYYVKIRAFYLSASLTQTHTMT